MSNQFEFKTFLKTIRIRYQTIYRFFKNIIVNRITAPDSFLRIKLSRM
ncbi:hypothetical protein LEP1GSC088_2470 [Leptospira interrogans str. L1207]|nr:hypothetical protein LEP1GSC088_2470 [Leptospira interrogans str. L1207]